LGSLTVAHVASPADKAARQHLVDVARDRNVDVLVADDDVLFTSVKLAELQPR